MVFNSGSMLGRVIVVTGANAGIGKATTLGLANMGATLVMVCRSRKRGEAALADIKRKSGRNSISLFLADLSSQASIRKLARDLEDRYPAIHVLINNAAIITRKRILTEDNLELQFAVNHLAYFLLTNLLLDRLKDSAKARILSVTSEVHKVATLDFNDLQSEGTYRPNYVYAQTKLANLFFTYELARRLEGTGVTCNCVHPGIIRTNLLAEYMRIPESLKTIYLRIPRWLRLVKRMRGGSVEEGARALLYLAASPEVDGISGRYFQEQREVKSSQGSYDKESAERLWKSSLELVGLQETTLKNLWNG